MMCCEVPEPTRPWNRKHSVGGLPLVVLGERQDKYRIMALCSDESLQERVVVGVFPHESKREIEAYENAVNSNSIWERQLLAAAACRSQHICHAFFPLQTKYIFVYCRVLRHNLNFQYLNFQHLHFNCPLLNLCPLLLHMITKSRPSLRSLFFGLKKKFISIKLVNKYNIHLFFSILII